MAGREGTESGERKRAKGDGEEETWCGEEVEGERGRRERREGRGERKVLRGEQRGRRGLAVPGHFQRGTASWQWFSTCGS